MEEAGDVLQRAVIRVIKEGVAPMEEARTDPQPASINWSQSSPTRFSKTSHESSLPSFPVSTHLPLQIVGVSVHIGGDLDPAPGGISRSLVVERESPHNVASNDFYSTLSTSAHLKHTHLFPLHSPLRRVAVASFLIVIAVPTRLSSGPRAARGLLCSDNGTDSADAIGRGALRDGCRGRGTKLSL